MRETFQRPSYEYLLKFYLRQNLLGAIGDFNKKYFPNDYEVMKRAYEEIQHPEFLQAQQNGD